MSSEKADQLREHLAGAPQTLAIVEAVLATWPDHAAYLLKSFQSRSPAIMAASEAAAGAARKLMAGDEARFADDYRWTCDKLRDEELYFHREGRYRLSTFAEALAEVYSDHAYMGRYVNGLLLTQVLWYNHVATFEMFLNRLLGTTQAPFDYLEIGPGHGLMPYFAALSPLAGSLEAWDVSSVSLRETRAALDRLETPRDVALVEVDILRATLPPKQFDIVVISEVLEPLEKPDLARAVLRKAVKPDGRVFVNVPLNSPSPDHIYLLSSPEEATALAEQAGFRVAALELFATQGRKVESALAHRISVSAGMILAPA